jgi:ABC-type sulfate transport system permease component
MRARASSPLPWLGGLLVLYLLVPIIAFVVRLAGGAPASPGLGSALATSLFTATIATAVIVVMGTPLAYLLAGRRGVGGRVLLALVALPLALPTLMSGILLLYVVGPFTIPGELFGGKLTDTRAGIPRWRRSPRPSATGASRVSRAWRCRRRYRASPPGSC